MIRRLKTINSLSLAVALVLLFGGAAYALTQVARDVSATVNVQISAPNGIEIYLDAGRTLPANNIAFGTVVVDPFGTPATAGSNPVPVWVENQSNSSIELTLTDDLDQADVVLVGSNQAPILQPGEVLPVELLLNFHRGVAGTHPFTVMFQAEGPVPPPTEVTVYPGDLRVMVGDFASERFDVAYSLGLAGDLNYGRLLHGFLISDKANREMVPGIASAWNLSDDGLTWTFTIREGVMWHDGTELTPEDVLWSFQHLYGPEAKEHVIAPTAIRLSREADRIELDGRDVKLTTVIPATYVASTLSESGTGWYHVMPARDELYNQAVEVAYDQHPIGAGPMKFVEHVRASSITMERFDDFYYQPDNGFPEDKRIPFEQMTLYLVPEESTRVAALRAGDADIAPVSLAARNQVEAGGGKVIFGREGSFVWVPMMGCWADPELPCAKLEFRQALNYAIDKELIRDQLYGGTDVFEVKGWAAVTPSTIGYTPAVDPFPYDPERARQLLAEAGYPGGAGVGTVVLHTWESTSMPFQTQAAQLAAEFWKRELGLDVDVRVGDSIAIRGAWAAGELNGQIIWRDNETRRDATSITVSGYGDAASEIRRSEDPELQTLVQEAAQTVNDEARTQALTELYPLLRDASYEIGIGYANIPWGVGSRIDNWEPYPMAPNISGLQTIRLK